MFDKFLESNPKHNDQPYVKVRFNLLTYIVFRLSTSIMSESFYHIMCKGVPKNRSSKMSLFSILGEDKRAKLQYYRNNNTLYIMIGFEGVSVKI
jgi:hypothetical protein